MPANGATPISSEAASQRLGLDLERREFRRRLNALSLTPFVLLFLVATALSWQVLRQRSVGLLVDHSDAVIADVTRMMKLLVDLESLAEGAYYTPLKDLTNPRLVRLTAQIMSCEAQHWTVVSGLRNPGQYVKAIPWPYVWGSK